MKKTVKPVPGPDVQPVRDTLDEIRAELDEITADREKERRRYETLLDAARREERDAEEAARACLEAGDDVTTGFNEYTADASAARARAEAAERALMELAEKPLLSRAAYESMKETILAAAEIERQAFIEMLAIHAGTLAKEADDLAAYTLRANELLHYLQYDVYNNADRAKDKHGRPLFPSEELRVDNAGVIHTARSLALTPLLSGRVSFRDNIELATWNGESVE